MLSTLSAQTDSIQEITTDTNLIKIEYLLATNYDQPESPDHGWASSIISGDKLMHSAGMNLHQTLSGIVPGLYLLNSTGEPGNEGGELRIRGASSFIYMHPLIVVDGIPNRSIERLNPADIESIKLLKDASAAIYGIQGANGVILVTTRRGKTGKPTVRINVNTGFQQPTMIPEMANAATYATMLNEIAYFTEPLAGMNQVYSPEDIQAYADGSDPWSHPNTDWFGEVFKPWSMQHNEHVSVSGGENMLRYYFSMGDRFQDGIYYNSATFYRQQDFRSNVDLTVSKNISISVDVAGRQEVRNYPTVSTYDNFRMLLRGKPNMPAYWPNGNPGPDIEYGHNPVVTTTDATGYDNNKNYYLETNMKLIVKIPWVNGLSFQGSFSYDKHLRDNKILMTPWYVYTWDGVSYENGEPVTIEEKRGVENPILSLTTEDDYMYTYNMFLKYRRSGSIGNLEVTAGLESLRSQDIYKYLLWKDILISAIDRLIAGTSVKPASSYSSLRQFNRGSYSGCVSYNYDSRYMLKAVLRYEASPMFSVSRRWGFFPAFSFGWRISEEDFFNVGLFDDLKMRVSWGKSGNDRIYDDSDYYGTNIYELSGSSYVNPSLKWEESNQFNFGFTTTLLNSHLVLEADYFRNLRTDIPIMIPEISGVSFPPQNIGEVLIRGFEYILGVEGGSGSLNYSISTSGCFAKNKILFWDETPGIPDYQQATGQAMGAGLYYEATGIFHDLTEIEAYPHWRNAQPGDIIFRDVDENGLIDGLDRVRQEKSNVPRFTGGLSAGLSYNGFDLMMTLQGCSGAVVYVNPESGEIGNYFEEYAINRWRTDNSMADYPRAWNRDNEYWRSQRNTFWLKETDYLRLKNLQVGYSLSESTVAKLKMQGLRIYLSGSNLFTFSKLKLFDPELAGANYYPLLKVLNIGMTVEF